MANGRLPFEAKERPKSINAVTPMAKQPRLRTFAEEPQAESVKLAAPGWIP
ncbi:hypothetical protein C8C99_3346 [Acidovorax sp. 107]|nr:hypothetical protein C8C99_3346 [Acidovorax sp. 107]